LKTKTIKHILINVEVVHVLELLMPLIYLILAMRHIVNINHVIYNLKNHYDGYAHIK
jgi:hypothetical protein